MNLPVVLCIGSVGVSGDSLGPMVGDALREKYNVRAYVYGGTSQPVNGINYNAYINHIKTKHKNSLIIAVDACVGESFDVGKVKYTLKGISAGGALNKKLDKVGHLGILGVVAAKQENNLQALMAVPYHMVEEMSLKVASKINRLLLEWEMKCFKITKLTQNNHFSRCKLNTDMI